MTSFVDNAFKARTYTPEDVGDFLSSIKLDKYREAFVTNEVNGADLLEANRDTLNELGVTSLLDCVRIMTLFPRQLQGAEPRFPVSVVLKVLKENKLEKYIKIFEENQIDGDMILYAEEKHMKIIMKDDELVRSVFTEIGISSNIHKTRILSRFKTFVSEQYSYNSSTD